MFTCSQWSKCTQVPSLYLASACKRTVAPSHDASSLILHRWDDVFIIVPFLHHENCCKHFSLSFISPLFLSREVVVVKDNQEPTWKHPMMKCVAATGPGQFADVLVRANGVCAQFVWKVKKYLLISHLLHVVHIIFLSSVGSRENWELHSSTPTNGN